MALATVLPPAHVAHQLRVRLADLTKHITARQAAPPALAAATLSPSSLGFVEVPPAPAQAQVSLTIQLELSRPDGTRLCLHAPAAMVPLDAVVRAFVEGS